jgi:putative endonuclease
MKKTFEIKNKKPFDLTLGDRGEMAGAAYLARSGYRLLETNYRCAVGEIDVVAEREGRHVFVEINPQDHDFGAPEEAVHAAKQRKLVQLAQCYLKERKCKERRVSFDVLALTWDLPGEPRFRLIPDAFGMSD